MWYLFIPAAVAATVASYLLITQRSALLGDRIVVYQRGLGAATYLIDHGYIPAGYEIYAVDSAQDVLDIIASHNRISRFIILAHGGPTWLLDRDLTPDRLARALASRLTWGAITGMAGCSTGRSPSEPDVWDSSHIYADGGADSYGGVFRDRAISYGAPRSAEGRTHAIYGHITANPTGRTMYFSEPGAPGRALKPAHLSNSEWVTDFQGGPAATEWMLGVS